MGEDSAYSARAMHVQCSSEWGRGAIVGVREVGIGCKQLAKRPNPEVAELTQAFAAISVTSDEPVRRRGSAGARESKEGDDR